MTCPTDSNTENYASALVVWCLIKN